MKYFIYNPCSGHGKAVEYANAEKAKNEEGIRLVDITAIKDYAEFFSKIGEDDSVTVCGGDGTLNRFINDSDGVEKKCHLLYYPCGTGNDFYSDVNEGGEVEAISVDEYLKRLPTVTVNGKDYKFINGVGYGIDGYCCEVGDRLREKNKKTNYTMIAIKGLLFHFKPRRATVVVDGVEHEYKKVWIAPTMFGKRYGGGMLPTPEQKRSDDELSICVFHGSGKLKTLMIFPSLFTGKHVEKTKNVEVLSGKDITVRFDRPTSLQIDGETILGVTEYNARI